MSACIGIENFEKIIKERNKRYKNKVQYNATLKKRIVNKQKRIRWMMRAMTCTVLNEPLLNIEQWRITHNSSECSQIILEYTRLIQNILYNNLYTYKVKSILEPSGYIRNTFNNSLYWANKPSFEKAIIGAVNDGGDADTIAAITGSIAGARFGYDAIPQRWIDQLDSEVKIYLEKFKNFVFSYLQI